MKLIRIEVPIAFGVCLCVSMWRPQVDGKSSIIVYSLIFYVPNMKSKLDRTKVSCELTENHYSLIFKHRRNQYLSNCSFWLRWLPWRCVHSCTVFHMWVSHRWGSSTQFRNSNRNSTHWIRFSRQFPIRATWFEHTANEENTAKLWKSFHKWLTSVKGVGCSIVALQKDLNLILSN